MEPPSLIQRWDQRSHFALRLPPQFLALLRERRVLLSVGKRVVASVRPYETAITRLIEELNLDLEVAFNRESIMVLPF
jgi:hypothetical protein